MSHFLINYIETKFFNYRLIYSLNKHFMLGYIPLNNTTKRSNYERY